MNRSKKILLSAVAVVVIAAIALTIVITRVRMRRHRVFRPAGGEVTTKAPKTIPPVAQWTLTFESLDAPELVDLLDRIEKQQPNDYERLSLAYLHARALLESGEFARAETKFAPYLAAGNPLQDLALYHASEVAAGRDRDADASRLRQQLILGAKDSIYRDQAIDEELDYLGALADPAPLASFASKIAASAPTARRREMQARIIEIVARRKQWPDAKARALALLRAGTNDDAADRAARAIDQDELLKGSSAAEAALVAETLKDHRHYDRAIQWYLHALASPGHQVTGSPGGAPQSTAAMLAAAKKKPATKKAAPSKKAAPAKKKGTPAKAAAKPAPAAPPRNSEELRGTGGTPREEILFQIGRCHFGAERYADAQKTYSGAANQTRDPKWKSTLLFHASRAAQLQGDDAGAERLMTASLAVPGRFPSTTAALTQRMRTRLKQGRVGEAAGDLAQLRRLAPNDRAVYEGGLAFAVAAIARGDGNSARVTLDSVPRALLDPYDVAEVTYWRARSLESTNPGAAISLYLDVLGAKAQTHFSTFARQRLAAPPLAAALRSANATRDAQVKQLIAQKQWALAKDVETDRLLLTPAGQKRDTARLAQIYRELPAYDAVLSLEPDAFPTTSDDTKSRGAMLMSLGLFDEATDAIEQRWGLSGQKALLTRSLALNRAQASRESIYAIEVFMKTVPQDYLPELLPTVVQHLLYPRYFEGYVNADAKKYGADPALVLSIMREESRFDPRAKSQAAARGLLQFIMTTAHDIGRQVGLVDLEPDDLYDPRVIIQLGAKYVAELLKRFDQNHYRAAAAYNAGPYQTALWSRLASAPGDDFFLSAINFDETKHYVRKVMNSYGWYGAR